MIYSVQQIKFEVLGYIKEFGANFGDWYIGISDRPHQALKDRHGVDEVRDIWLCKQAVSLRACQTIQRYFTSQLKVDGDQAGQGSSIYLFRKSEHTIPPSEA
jgi:hypothetical protein